MTKYIVTTNRTISQQYRTVVDAQNEAEALKAAGKTTNAVLIGQNTLSETPAFIEKATANGAPNVTANLIRQRIDPFSQDAYFVDEIEIYVTPALEMLIGDELPDDNIEAFLHEKLPYDETEADPYLFNDQIFYNAVELGLVSPRNDPFELSLCTDEWQEYVRWKLESFGFTITEPDDGHCDIIATKDGICIEYPA